ncbi:3-hydroxybutyryl-CoA dehydrogenase (EC [Olavius algarvensis Delta 1 endosymbiont]|nr:3-hydroxybutyryl-CoA dehydrogenase (EC [Olavius algarvensis Delta 1 endosymbiont]
MRDDIKKVACVGSGLIGQGWATLFAGAGFRVAMQDISDEQLKSAREQVRLNLIHLEDNVRLLSDTAAGAYESIRTTLSLAEAVENADYILESVPDKYSAKKPVFKEMDALAPAHTILASSSSGLLMTEIQTAVTRPERCVLVHPFLPVHLLPLVEVVGGEQTVPETIDITCRLMEKIGKAPVRLKKEVSGYIVNRLQAAILREAMDLVASGVASAQEVDQAFCTGMGMRDPFIGPLLRAHLAGNGIESFLENYAESYRLRWGSMATWDTISDPIREAVVGSVNEMPVVRDHALEEIKKWRDEKLMEMLKLERTMD